MRLLIILSLLTTSALAQSANQAAVDTLTKDVATVVFARIQQPKAQEIYAMLRDCGDGCDPQTIIRTVGGWDAVGAKMQELSELKNTAQFNSMAPAEANTAIRKQLAQFYARYKTDNNYGKPLTPPVQAQIIARIDQLLPPAPAPEPTATVTESSASSSTVADEGTGIDPNALRLSQLEREQKEKQDNQLWMMILSGIVGLLVGAAGIYFALYRRAKAEIERLTDDNQKLSRDVDFYRRTKPANEPRQSQNEPNLKARAYDAIINELGTSNPLEAIKELKKQSTTASKPAPRPRFGEPTIESALVGEPDPIQVQTPIEPLPPLEPLPPIARSEVFYCPPPDQNGQFDVSQKSPTLIPESAYRFSVSADNPTLAMFRFEADPGRVARFLTYRNYMIEPACESENPYSSVHTRIAMRRDGEATLENGTWRVKTKALIRYE
ncbi:hypothetical protein IC229_27885 [Spirosoma sp. BT702]|uniref:Uncharacterized protein n=1 Tax=Spirosoma profusum TaxID=2771354 RepID=A0A926Y4E9_9BACT|nr:hypothetical protein [Spirosoma profusum]MBD2704493.1 hypothetical protein [Spirosoma profusum]